MTSQPSSRALPGAPVRTEGGIALVTVLLLVALLTITLLSFFYLVRNDRTRSRSFLESMKSRLMIESALEEVKAKIMDGSELDRPGEPSWKPWVAQAEPGGFPYRAQAHMTAAPGLMEVRYFDIPPDRDNSATGNSAFDSDKWFRDPFNPKYNPRWIPLFSYKWFAPSIRFLRKTGDADTLANVSDPNPDYNPAAQFNLNTIQNPFYPGELYLSGSPDRTVGFKYAKDSAGNYATKGTEEDFVYSAGESSLDRPVYVQWMPIYQNPGKGPVYTENGTSRTNRIVGRYAYWVDVENTKINLNASDRLYDESEWNAIVGVSDGSKSVAGQSYFSQTGVTNTGALVNTSMTNRYAIEKSMLKQGTYTNAVGGNSIQVDNTAAATYFNTWFSWGNSRPDGDRPYAADTGMVDWRAITGMRPRSDGSGTNLTTEALVQGYDPVNQRFNTPFEVFSLQDPQVQLSNETRGRLQMAAMRRTYGLSTTIYGYEDERDPLGKPKVDLGRLQLDGIGSTAYTLLLRRLGQNSEYYKAYYPNGYPTGAGKTLAQALAPFAGTGQPADGLAVVEQMLVNIVASGQPHTNAPASMPGWAPTFTSREKGHRNSERFLVSICQTIEINPAAGKGLGPVCGLLRVREPVRQGRVRAGGEDQRGDKRGGTGAVGGEGVGDRDCDKGVSEGHLHLGCRGLVDGGPGGCLQHVGEGRRAGAEPVVVTPGMPQGTVEMPCVGRARNAGGELVVARPVAHGWIDAKDPFHHR